MHELVGERRRQPQAEEVQQRQVDGDEEGILGGVDHLVRQAAPEQAQVAGIERDRVPVHAVLHGAAEDEVDLDLGVPMRPHHDAGLLVTDHQIVGQPLRRVDFLGSHMPFRELLTILQFRIPVLRDERRGKGPALESAQSWSKRKGRTSMHRIHSRWRSAVGLAFGVSLLSIAAASAAEVTVWCWDPNFNGATMKEAAARYTAAASRRDLQHRRLRQGRPRAEAADPAGLAAPPTACPTSC